MLFCPTLMEGDEGRRRLAELVLELAQSLGCVSFFFSSRRRHTRCSRDWSSDVCSSDLAVGKSLHYTLPQAQFSPLIPDAPAFANICPGPAYNAATCPQHTAAALPDLTRTLDRKSVV